MPTQLGNCIVPTPFEVESIGPQFYPAAKQNLLFINTVLPTKYVGSPFIVKHQPDFIRGMQQYRGALNTPPPISGQFNRYGTMCVYRPSYWGEYWSITEQELTMSAEPGICANGMLDAQKEVMRQQARLTHRMLMRMEYNSAQTVRLGRYQAVDKAGNVVEQQYYRIRRRIAVPFWTDLVNSAPLTMFTEIASDYIDSEASFSGPRVRIIMNSRTLSVMFQNQNPFDLGRGNQSACCTTLNLGWIQGQMDARGLGHIEIYDEKWVDDNGGVHKFLPDGYVIVIGTRRDAQYPGNYNLTVVVNDCLEGPEKGLWYFYKDNCGQEIQREIRIGAGHNGVPILDYPEMIISIRVF